MTDEKIDKSMFEDWMKHPITKEVMNIIVNTSGTIEEAILSRRISNQEDVFDLTFLKGRLSAMQNFLNIGFADIEESLKENQENANG